MQFTFDILVIGGQFHVSMAWTLERWSFLGNGNGAADVDVDVKHGRVHT